MIDENATRNLIRSSLIIINALMDDSTSLRRCLLLERKLKNQWRKVAAFSVAINVIWGALYAARFIYKYFN